jgi:hypothetical protein
MSRLERVRIIIAGSRPPSNIRFSKVLLDLWHNTHYQVVINGVLEFESKFAVVAHEVISGEALGYDTLGSRWSKEYLRKAPISFPALWTVHGNSAGMIRNGQMIEEGKPWGLLAFWDGNSSGTAHMIRLAEKAGLRVLVKKIIRVIV